MMKSRFVLLAYASACSTLLLNLPASAQTEPEWKRHDIVTKTVPNLPPAQCRSQNGPGNDPKCPDLELEVVVNPLFRGGKTIGCAAFFYYRDLTIVTPQRGGGEATFLKWKITDVGAARGADAKFVSPAIRISSKPGSGKPDPNELLEPPTITSDRSAEVKVKKQATRKEFDHLPVVEYKDDSLAWTKCGGVDPTIANNPS